MLRSISCFFSVNASSASMLKGNIFIWAFKGVTENLSPVGHISLGNKFTTTCIMHPDTYLEQVLLGSQEALDVVAVGCSDGKIHVHNILRDIEIVSFTHSTKDPVISATDGQPLLASGGSSDSMPFGCSLLYRISRVEKVKEAEIKLKPVIAFDVAEIRERDWCNVVTCHVDTAQAHPEDPTPVVGLNLQSGISRGSYLDMSERKPCAHDGEVVGVACDSTNTIMISAGSCGDVKVWDFKGRELKSRWQIDCALVKIVYHLYNGLLATTVADDLVIRLFDVVALRMEVVSVNLPTVSSVEKSLANSFEEAKVNPEEAEDAHHFPVSEQQIPDLVTLFPCCPKVIGRA
ncbi:UNVERIFIED_CONTAM: WD repeat-containing protein 36 [Sesamum indicum]